MIGVCKCNEGFADQTLETIVGLIKKEPFGSQTADKPQLFNWGLLFLGPLYQYSSDIQKQHNEK